MTTLIISLALLTPIKHSDKPQSPYDGVCFSVTNYWPFNAEGELIAFNGQTDSDPTRTANMTLIEGPHQAWQWVAAPLDLVGESIYLPNIGTLPVNDTFGDMTYQSGAFWHEGYGEWVIGVDVFTDVPLHYLECGGEVIYHD